MSTQAYDLSESLTKPTFAITQFSVDEIISFWPKIEDMLDRVPHTWKHWTKEYIRERACLNGIQVWAIGPPPDAVLILFTEVSVYPAMRVLNVVWAAGTFRKQMVPLLDATFTNFAKLNDCTMIEIRGRRGWLPHLRALNFQREAEVWSRRVPSMRMN